MAKRTEASKKPSAKGPASSGKRAAWNAYLIAGAIVAVLAAVLYAQPGGTTVPVAMRVRVVRTIPHDPDAFTQGLVWKEGRLFESTGLRRASTVREVDPESGRVLRKQDLDGVFFGEGLALVGDDRLVQLTWRNQKALIWDLETFRKVGEHRYDSEGWGLCHDGEHFVMSDGTDTLTVRASDDFRVLREVRVVEAGRPVRWLNELECVDGEIYANVWQSDRIVRIDLDTGEVNATIDASGLLTREEQDEHEVDVLNGIAWIPERERFLITGKNWPKMFEVEFVEVGEE